MGRQGVTMMIVGLAAVVLPTTAAATPLSELAASLEPGEWGELPATDLLPLVSETNGGATGSIFPYAEEAVWHGGTGQVIFIGSDHIYDGMSSGARMLRYVDGNDEWFADPIPWAPSGTMHGYDHSAIYNGYLYQMTLVVDQPVYRYDPATGSWDERAQLPFTGYNRFGGLEPFPEIGGLVYVEGNGVYAYDDAVDSWSVVADGVPMGAYHNFAEYSPPHGIVLLGGGNGSGALHTLDADLTLTDRGAAPFTLRVNDAIITHDPNGGDFLVFGGEGEFLVYDVEADELLVQDVEVPFFDSDEPVALTVAAAIDSYGVVMFIEHDGIALDGSATVWIYRHEPGMGRPPGDPPDDDGGNDDGTDDGVDDGRGETGDGGPGETGDDGIDPDDGNAGSGDQGNDDAGPPADAGAGATAEGGGTDGGGDGGGSTGGGCRIADADSGSLWGWGALVLLLAARRRRWARRLGGIAAATSLAACGTPSDDEGGDPVDGGAATDPGDDDDSPADDDDDTPGDNDDAPGNDAPGDDAPGDDAPGDDDDDDPPVPSGGCFGPGELPPTGGPSGFAIPTLEDERAAYEAFGWAWDSSAEPDYPTEPDFYVSDPDIHYGSEGDDLWTYLMMYERTGEPGYLDRADAWARYFKEDYAPCVGSYDRTFCFDVDGFGADHLYGWGLIAYAQLFDDADALAAAEQLGDMVDTLWAPNSPFGCLPSNGCTHYGVRQIGRHLLFVTRLAEVTGDAKWVALRDQIIDTVVSSADYDQQHGMFFYGDWSTDGELGEGSYAAGDRITSPFQLGVLSEALDHAYRVTGREDVRDVMVAMAEFVDEYGLDEQYQYAGSSFGIVGGQPYHSYSATEPVTFWDPVYTTSLVNVLMRGYRYTCDIHFHERARHFFERGNKGIYGEPTERAAPDGQVHHFVDTVFSSADGYFYLDYNKGELQYTYLLFAPLAIRTDIRPGSTHTNF